MNTENERINELVNTIKKRVADRSKYKNENMIQEQGNLQFDDETPETTIKRARNSKPRGSKPKEQNLSYENQNTIKTHNSVEEGISEMRIQLRETIEKNSQEEKNKKEQKSEQNRKERIKKINDKAKRLSKSFNKKRT